MRKGNSSETESFTELWEQKACRLALFSTAELTACWRRDGTRWGWGAISSPDRLLWLTHSPVHTRVQFPEQPHWLLEMLGPGNSPSAV